MDATDTPQRNPFPALFNFRDVGGLTGHDGRTVRRGRLYRSDSLHRIDETDREMFTASASVPSSTCAAPPRWPATAGCPHMTA